MTLDEMDNLQARVERARSISFEIEQLDAALRLLGPKENGKLALDIYGSVGRCYVTLRGDELRPELRRMIERERTEWVEKLKAV